MSNIQVSREMNDFIRWNEITNPALIYEDITEQVPSIDVYMAGCWF